MDADNISLRAEASTGGTKLKYMFAATCDVSRTSSSPHFLGLAAFPVLAHSMLDISVDSSPSRIGKSFSTVKESESPPPLLPPSPLSSSSLLVFTSLHLLHVVGALAALMRAPPREHCGQALKEGKHTRGSPDTTQTDFVSQGGESPQLCLEIGKGPTGMVLFWKV